MSHTLEFLQRPNSDADSNTTSTSTTSPPIANMSYADMAAKGPKQTDEEVSHPTKCSIS